MATVAKWITKNGHRVYLRKGGSKGVHNDFYRVEGKGVSGMNGTPLHFIDKKRAIEVAKANVRINDMKHKMSKNRKDKK